MVTGAVGQTGLHVASHVEMVSSRGHENVTIQYRCMEGSIAQESHQTLKSAPREDVHLVRAMPVRYSP